MIRYNRFLGVYQFKKTMVSQWYEITENQANILYQEGHYYVR